MQRRIYLHQNQRIHIDGVNDQRVKVCQRLCVADDVPCVKELKTHSCQNRFLGVFNVFMWHFSDDGEHI